MTDDEQHGRIYRTLRDLRGTLEEMVERDPDQEVRGVAIPVVDAVISEARQFVENDMVLQEVRDVISPESLAEGESVRAADVLPVVRIMESRIGKPASWSEVVRSVPMDREQRRRGRF